MVKTIVELWNLESSIIRRIVELTNKRLNFWIKRQFYNLRVIFQPANYCWQLVTHYMCKVFTFTFLSSATNIVPYLQRSNARLEAQTCEVYYH